MDRKEFRFQGLDARTELKLALILILPAAIIMLGVLWSSHVLFPKISFLIPIVFGASLTLAVSIIILKWLAHRIKEKEWIVHIEGNSLNLKFRNLEHHIQLSDIKIIKNLGNEGLRYLTIKTTENTFKIRIGNIGLAPFSEQKDIEEFDAFIQYLKPYLDTYFNKKVFKNMRRPDIIPNFGVYVVKGQEIKYSLINRMKPWQIVLCVIAIFILIMIFLMTGFIYYIDRK